MEMLMNIAVLGPLVAASVTTWLAGGSLRSWAGQILIWHTGLRWYLATLGLPVLLVAAQVGMYLLLGGEDPVELAAIPTRFVYLRSGGVGSYSHKICLSHATFHL